MPHKIQIGGVLQDGSRPWTGTAITLHAGMHYIDTGDLEVLAWDQAFLFFPTGFSVGRVVNAVLQAQSGVSEELQADNITTNPVGFDLVISGMM